MGIWTKILGRGGILKHQESGARFLGVWARDLSLSLVIAAIVILFLYQPIEVEGTSMMPSLIDQERIFIDKFTYKLGAEKIRRGDMVVFWFPGEPGRSYIKRVVGLPGDRVRIDQGVVYLNGTKLEEDYVPPRYRDKVSIPELRGERRLVLRLGRPPLLLQRQSRLGAGRPPLHLRKSSLHLLAAGQNRAGTLGRPEGKIRGGSLS
jgi:signal peptidase I